MRYIVLIYDDSDEGRFVNRFRDGFLPRSLASALPPTALVPAGTTWRSLVSRLEISRLSSLAHRPLVRWATAPILGIPTVYSGYNTMLNFWHGLGVSPSPWLHILAVVAGVASGLAVIARLRT
jgi:hypothetical protein